MELSKVIKKYKYDKQVVLEAIAYEHNINKLVPKSELDKWVTVNLDLTPSASKILKQMSKRLKLNEESVLFGCIITALTRSDKSASM